MKRLSLFCGHFGCGKTNVSIHYAEKMAAQGLPVTIADLDIVNPYFRTKDSEEELRAQGIEVMTLPFANTSVDLPSLPKFVYSLFTGTSGKVVLDIGGDDRGALVLGRFVPFILEENDYDLFYVVNFYRYLTRTPQEALDVMREIEAACGLSFTAVINNSNLGRETTAQTVAESAGKAKELCTLAGLPLFATMAAEGVDLAGTEVMRLQKGY